MRAKNRAALLSLAVILLCMAAALLSWPRTALLYTARPDTATLHSKAFGLPLLAMLKMAARDAKTCGVAFGTIEML